MGFPAPIERTERVSFSAQLRTCTRVLQQKASYVRVDSNTAYSVKQTLSKQNNCKTRRATVYAVRIAVSS